MSADFLAQAVIYLTAAVVSVPIARRLGLGSVIGYLLAGVIIGPFALRLVGTEGADVMHFAEFGVVMMLFIIGLELRPALLWKLRAPILGIGGLQVLLTAAAVAALCIMLGVTGREAIAIGLILSLSSTAIVLQTLNEKGLLKTAGGETSFAVLLFQDIAVIPMLALLPLLALRTATSASTSDHGSSAIANLPAWAQTIAVLGAVAAIIIGGRFLIRPVLRVIASTKLREIFTAASLLIVVGIALLMSRVGVSPALGAFLAGVVLADSEYRHELESDIEPFRGLLLGLFFIGVGASIDFALITSQPLLVLGLVLGIIALKGIVLYMIARAFKVRRDQALFVAFALPQVGEFAFVLFSFAEQEHVLPQETTAVLIAVVALSMAMTPLLILFNERVLAPRHAVAREQREPDAIEESNPVLIAGFGSFGSTVGRLLRANGIGTTVLDIDSDRVETLRRLGLKVYYGDATRMELLHAAGAERARLIVLSLDSAEKTLSLVHTIRHTFPHLRIYARAFEWEDTHTLVSAGVDHVYREALDTSLRMGTDVMHQLGFRAHHALRVAQKFRIHDEAAVRALTDRFDDKAAYLGEARRRIEELEQLLLADLADSGFARDDGWDAESLRAEYGTTS